MTHALYVGADLGGTHFRAAVRAAGAETLLDQEARPADAGWDVPALVETLEEMLERMRRRHPGADWRLAGVGMGLTGDIDPESGTCHSMTRFPRLEGAALAAALAERFGRPAQILNDGLTATLAEHRLGAGRGARSILMVTLGTGVGGGIVLDGRLFLGPHGRGGKVGHQILDLEGPVHCHCGLPGCWQSLVGIAGVTARAREAAARRPGSALAAAVASPAFILRDLSRLAAEGDPASREVMQSTGRLVGIGLANLVKVLAPERVIVGGGIAEGSDLLIAAARSALHEYAVLPYQRIPLLPAALGHGAGVVGATLLPELPG